ncbi:SAPS-domain-containing protein [Panus rudis PR-1116 ss-1]|nr:SAPS-domain-containing protein [Panus rudis PR-1116 ss-1]
MFWRFGFHNASTIDSLLDKEDISLEAILDEDELLQECKAQNTRLIDYFQRVDVLQRLLGYVTGQIESGEEKGSFKYPYVATEVLCSEIWSIVETCLKNSEQLLTPFWETVLDRSPEDMKTQMVMASHFAKINAVFLSKKPAEMLAFIQSQPNVVDRILRHIETPPFADLLVRIIQLDEHPSGAGVLEWLSRENLMSKLIDRLSPSHSANMHTVVADLIKGIISMAAPSPGAGLGDGMGNVPPSNRFARELAHRDSVTKLTRNILSEFPKTPETSPSQPATANSDAPGYNDEPPLPNAESTTSSIVQSICIIIELIRQNNSDYFEPYLFHTLRNRLIQVQQHLQMHTQDGREALEKAMKDMVNRMGVVHLGPVLEIMCDKLEELQKYLRNPRSMSGPVLTTVGALTPLTFERYRICELYAELLHCSNMSLLNRPPEYEHLYDSEGRLQGGLSALEELAQVIAIGSGNDRDGDGMDDDEDDIESAHDFPVHATNDSLMDSDEDMSGDEPGSSDEEAMEDISIDDEPSNTFSRRTSKSPSPLPETPLERYPSGSPSLAAERRQNSGSDSDGSTARPRSRESRRSTRRSSALGALSGHLVLGERLKQRFLEVNVASTLLDLFFDFPWNNFLHSIVYDLIHQVLTGRIDTGYNRELTVALFRDAKLMHRIIEGSKRNDIESAKPKGVRLGYMGHLTLISEDVITAMEHFPPDLRLQIAQYAPQPEWDEYVTGRYKETKKKDSSLLGGGKPVIAPGMRAGGASQWKVDEADTAGTATVAPGANREGGQELNGELRRQAKAREGSADFGAAPMEDDDEDSEFHAAPPHFARYLAQEMQSSSEHFSSDEASDDEEDGGWLAQSTFELRPTPLTPHPTEGRSNSGFDDAYRPGSSSEPAYTNDPFDDDFGPFSDAAAPPSSTDTRDAFNLSAADSGATEEMIEESSFDSFGDFGDFQSPGSVESTGALSPSGGSWSFDSISSASSIEEHLGNRERMTDSPKEPERTA